MFLVTIVTIHKSYFVLIVLHSCVTLMCLSDIVGWVWWSLSTYSTEGLGLQHWTEGWLVQIADQRKEKNHHQPILLRAWASSTWLKNMVLVLERRQWNSDWRGIEEGGTENKAMLTRWFLPTPTLSGQPPCPWTNDCRGCTGTGVNMLERRTSTSLGHFIQFRV